MGSGLSENVMPQSTAKLFVYLFAAAVTHSGMAETMPETTVEGAHWRIESAAKFDDEAVIASQRNEQILVWDVGGTAHVAGAAVLLVNAPYDQVQRTVQQALKPLGTFEFAADTSPLAYLPDGWDEVLLSRRSDLRNALVDRFTRPQLQQAVEQGALMPAEMEQRLASVRASVDSVPQQRIELDAFRTSYASWYATQNTSYGLTGKRSSELTIKLFDATAMFAQPATVIQMKRVDSYPNPAASLWNEIRNFDVLSPSPAARLADSVVPARVFIAVRDAVAGLPGKVAIAHTPHAWVQPIPQPKTAPPLVLAAPAVDTPLVKAQISRWDTQVIDLHSSRYALIYPHDLLTLPDGDLLLSAEVSDGTSQRQRVWRLHDVAGAWRIEEVWRGANGTRHLSLSADGHTAWFDGDAVQPAGVDLMAYDIETRKIIAHSVTWPEANNNKLDMLRWELAGDQLPAIFDPLYRLDDTEISPALQRSSYLAILRPETAAPAENSNWRFKPALTSARQSTMDRYTEHGNTLIRPVRWRDAKAFWVEDPSGVAELDVSSGRVLRAWAMPQRSGRPDSNDGAGVAQWVPEPLGSPEAGWIATGFVLMLHDDGRMPPTLQTSASDNDRFVGMHVINIKDGHVLSALLGRSDTLRAAARSAHGRLLALGSNGKNGDSNGQAVLWDVAQGRTPVRLDTSQFKGEMYALAFSWDGQELWALGHGELFHWHLPDAIRDGVSQGNFPDQSHN